jgi:2-polyprenyl-6-methoxyphenol hydroxylase-like FAD-dependent oxidoreductase
MMLGLLLARAGVQATVLEKHRDFLRDFRGDTVHPSTLQVLHELGLLDDFLKLPHARLPRAKVVLDDREFAGPDFSLLSTKCKFIALMPQWDFLNFLASRAAAYPSFRLLMETEAVDVLRHRDNVVGVQARGPAGPVEIQADLVVACDGRHSRMRDCAGLEVIDMGVPIDVLWFRIGKQGEETHALGRVKHGKMLVTLDRGDYFQCGYIIRKGSFPDIQSRGLAAFHADLSDVAPFLAPHVAELDDWNKVKLLTVQINRLKRWHLPGLLFIGDAAHAMSPAGGVGINLAIQDAVAMANLLAGKLAARTVTNRDLAAVQRRREFPAVATQTVQSMLHNLMFPPESSGRQPLQLSWLQRSLVRLLQPFIPRLGAWAIGVGVRPEHVRC